MKQTSKPKIPQCVFCGRSGAGVEFAIFAPKFKPFGTACVECEKKHDKLPQMVVLHCSNYHTWSVQSAALGPVCPECGRLPESGLLR